MNLRLNIAAKTDKGKRRQKNEDSYTVDAETGFMVVADGMGGHAAGEVASQLAVKVCSEQLKRSLASGTVPNVSQVPADPKLDRRSLLLGACVKLSNQAVFEASRSRPEFENMGTTLVAALPLDGKLAIANVGDSRLYLVRHGRLAQRTIDHSFVQEQVDRGLMTAEAAEKSDYRNMLTRSIGIDENVDVDLMEIELNEGDFILLCSDGLSKMLDKDQIGSVFGEFHEPNDIARELIDRANAAGGGDNITVVVARVETASALKDRVKDILKRAKR